MYKVGPFPVVYRKMGWPFAPRTQHCSLMYRAYLKA